MVGLLLEVGLGKTDIERVRTALAEPGSAWTRGPRLRRRGCASDTSPSGGGSQEKRTERTRNDEREDLSRSGQSEIERRWYVVDATDQTLGRLASRIARVLEGKHKPTYQPNLDSGDHVIVLNARRIAVTSDKLESKVYARHSGYPQGFKEETLGHLLERRPEEVIRRAVKGMLPHNRLGAQQLRKLKIYAGADHPHQAQQPEPLA